MEDGAADALFYREARFTLLKTKNYLDSKQYKDAILNLYKAEEWCEYFSAVDPKFEKDNSFLKDVEKVRSKLKKVALKDKVSLDSLLNSLNLAMTSNLELKYHRRSYPIVPIF
jgi:hypothetical protein